MAINSKTTKRKNAGESGLTDLERRFALRYLADFNATESYMQATGGTVTRATARANGHRLLAKPEIQRLICEQRDRLLDEAELTVKEVLLKLRQFLMHDVRDLFDQQGNLKPMDQWPKDAALSVIGIKDTQWGREVKTVDKVAALDKAMRYHGLFEADNRQVGEAISEVVFKTVSAAGKRP